jgi:hypothetical protein
MSIHDLFNGKYSLKHRGFEDVIHIDVKLLVRSLADIVATGIIIAADDRASIVASHFSTP